MIVSDQRLQVKPIKNSIYFTFLIMNNYTYRPTISTIIDDMARN
jgi:hypothetical protein